MPTSPKPGNEFQLTKSTDTGDSLPAARAATKSLNKYSLFLAPGILGGLFAYVAYPPLDQGLLLAFGLCVLFLPLVLQVRSVWRKRLSDNARFLRTAFVCSSLVLALLALFLILNGRLDTSPQSVEKTTLIHKQANKGRGGTQYVLTVSSWRPGRISEDFTVDSRTFQRAIVGHSVIVELHEGYFGLPWSGKISPR